MINWMPSRVDWLTRGDSLITRDTVFLETPASRAMSVMVSFLPLPRAGASPIPHPGAAEVIAEQGTDANAIIARCIGDIPGDKRIFYQKHMTLHLLPELDRSWLSSLQNCFLIREPEAVIASYAAVRSDATLDDIGFVQQAELFDHVKRISGAIPPQGGDAELLRARLEAAESSVSRPSGGSRPGLASSARCHGVPRCR